MKKKPVLLYRLLTVLLLLVIAAAMFVVGRGHTIYLDNKTFEHEGVSHPAAYRAVVVSQGNEVAKLSKRDRGMATWMGQNLSLELLITKEKGEEPVQVPLQIKLPYHLDGIVINLPAFLAGLPQEVYQSEFVPQATETSPEEEEVVLTDEVLPGDV